MRCRLEVHHIVKRAQGGSDFDLDRLVALLSDTPCPDGCPLRARNGLDAGRPPRWARSPPWAAPYRRGRVGHPRLPAALSGCLVGHRHDTVFAAPWAWSPSSPSSIWPPYDRLAGLHNPGADPAGLHRGSLDLVTLVKIDHIERRRSPPRLPGRAEQNSSALRGCTPDNASVPMTGGSTRLGMRQPGPEAPAWSS